MIETGQSQAGFHRLDTLMHCLRAFGYNEVLKLVPFTSAPAPALGSAVHGALAAHYSGKHWTEGLKDPSPDWGYQVNAAKPIIEEYVKFWATKDRLLDIIAVEEEVVVEIEGLVFSRRIDVLYRTKAGKIRAMDHKTASNVQGRLGVTKWDASLFTQDLIGAIAIPNYDGMDINVIGTSKTPMFRRVPLVFSTEMMNQAWASISYWTKLAHELITSGISAYDYPQTWHCQQRYGMCDYFDLCQYGPAAESQYKRKVR